MNRLPHPVALLVCLLVHTAADAGIPPAGFAETSVVTNIPQITGFEWAPNGDIWIISKPGIVSVLHAGAGAPVIVATIPVNTVDERGLLGIAIDPDFGTNPYIYLYYTVDGSAIHNRVSRFLVVGDSLQNETVLLEGPPLPKVFHNSGNLRFGLDGLLYISMGDNAQPLMSQERTSLLGKILRIASDGSIPPDNPFVGDPNSRPEIWAYGLRNPWRFNIQPGTGNLFIGDVGDGTWEELDLGVEGANYGYPLVEGPQPPAVAGMTYPIYSYSHNGAGAAITGGDHMVAGNFPSQYLGDYFFGEFVQDRILRMRLDQDNLPISTENFVVGADSPVHIRVGPDGALYYASVNLGAIFRVAHVGGANQAPVAAATVSPASGLAPLSVQFDGTASFDPDGGPLSFSWFFGDETPGSAVTSPRHIFTNTGVYYPGLSVSDGQSNTWVSLRVVAGNRAPGVTILSPIDGSNYNAGDLISFSGSAVDPEDGEVPASGLAWSVLFHHNTHTHPWYGPTPAVTAGSFQTADSGETDTDVWFEIRLAATDTGTPIGSTGALTTTQSVRIYPNLGSFLLATSPVGNLALTLDGRTIVAPHEVTGVAGIKRDIGAITPQSSSDGHIYTFASWSDGGAPLHTITTPAAGTTFTAAYNCNLLAETTDLELVPGPDGMITLTWTRPRDPCLSSGPTIYHVYASPIPRPLSAPGRFPLDPPFSLIAMTATDSVTITPSAGAQFYLVTGIGSDGNEGPIGAYGR